MLASLSIKNIALIEELTVVFHPSLTIITGETGAGKSILMDSLSLVMGDRASSSMIRTGANKAVIEAILTDVHSETIEALLADAAIDSRQGELILRRELAANGQSRCFMNDTPCTLSLLRQAAEELIDLHGQHEHQLLLRSATHEGLLDDFAQAHHERATYSRCYQHLQQLQAQRSALVEKAQSLRDKKEFLDFQLQELQSAQLQEGEEINIEQEITLLENAEQLFTLTTLLHETLYNSDNSAYSNLTAALHTLEKLATIDQRFASAIEEARAATTIVDELARFARSYSADVEFNPERLEELRERQLLLQRMCRKYGRTHAELIAFEQELCAEQAGAESLDDELRQLEMAIVTEKKQLSQLAIILSEKRQKAATLLEAHLQQELALLGMPHARFAISITQQEKADGDIAVAGNHFAATRTGYDTVEFLLSANQGETARPLTKVASGGEISRVMLALKSALATSTHLPILVFDEIDTGISGRIAESVGKSLKKLSRLHQIIAITHLPQIAAMGDLHLSVQKSVRENRTTTSVTPLDGESRLHAIASLMSGEQISATSLNLAAELLAHGQAVNLPSI
uniref:DNA repair protein RecN n=1 Tax=Chlorobium chlorochromatii (strain CaD3) TaxID=340177 RepID=Q3APS5_CHLCH